MSLNTPDIVGEKILNLGEEGGPAFVARATDPVLLPQPYVKPTDFTAQYPQPLDPTEILAMCEEITAWAAIPEQVTALNGVTWREMNELAFTSGSAYIAFADGECPEEYYHDGDNTTISHKNIGAKKNLSERDIKHSMAVASANWHGINRLIGGMPSSGGLPGGSNVATFQQEMVADVKEKEVRTAMTLVMNGWDRLLIEGDATTRPLEFDGIEYQVTAANGSHVNSSAPSGTFSAQTFDRFLAESCAKPTHLFGHPMTMQETLSGYFQLGFAGSQVVNFNDGNRITPGFNFAGFVNTGVGRLAVVSDNNFNIAAASGTTFLGTIYALRMNHNGVPLVYKSTQIPLQLRDLTPGCTAISFEVWAATALIVKHRCAHGRFTAVFTGNIVTTCPVIG
jgi:hypothetical protein